MLTTNDHLNRFWTRIKEVKFEILLCLLVLLLLYIKILSQRICRFGRELEKLKSDVDKVISTKRNLDCSSKSEQKQQSASTTADDSMSDNVTEFTTSHNHHHDNENDLMTELCKDSENESDDDQIVQDETDTFNGAETILLSSAQTTASKKIENINELKFKDMLPLQADENGNYPTINWETDTNIERDWQSKWNKLIKKETFGRLYLPPLILPTHYGNWSVLLYMENNKSHELVMNGGIIFDHQHNTNAPANLLVNLTIEFSIQNNGETFQMNRQIVDLGKKSNGYNILWNVCKDVKESWQFPKATVKIN